MMGDMDEMGLFDKSKTHDWERVQNSLQLRSYHVWVCKRCSISKTVDLEDLEPPDYVNFTCDEWIVREVSRL